MIDLIDVCDDPRLFGSRAALLTHATVNIPHGRYALLSQSPEVHRAVVDVIAGLRPPRHGYVRHMGLVSWPIGRQGFVRGRGTGLRMIELVCDLYGIAVAPTIDFVSDLLTSPQYLTQAMEHWPQYVRQEFSFSLGLVPAFDLYVIEGAIPFEPCRFTRLWLALFEERIVGRTLILSTYRQNQMADYCTKGLIYEHESLRVDDDLDGCIIRFPGRQSRSDGGAGSEDVVYADGEIGV
ncbi:ATPase [Achromobacter seleniivolatilans]|uniref:ATPase n=1 Tax=Achromobacter seleniivolatilans TaxID=3047478 RepID=A0ABY9M231_9BURK|nr:ATPase [Achromobacter sp. R39]WMD20800.1 ATPase [Achromobacter sp. R39]